MGSELFLRRDNRTRRCSSCLIFAGRMVESLVRLRARGRVVVVRLSLDGQSESCHRIVEVLGLEEDESQRGGSREVGRYAVLACGLLVCVPFCRRPIGVSLDIVVIRNICRYERMRLVVWSGLASMRRR